jgi:hypothetical protein
MMEAQRRHQLLQRQAVAAQRAKGQVEHAGLVRTLTPE